MKLAVCFESRDRFSDLQVRSLENRVTVETEHDDVPFDIWESNHRITSNVSYAERCSRFLTPLRWKDAPFSVFIGKGICFHRDPRFVIDRANRDKTVTIVGGREPQVIFFNNRLCEGVFTPERIDAVYRDQGRVTLFDLISRDEVAFYPENFYSEDKHQNGSCLFNAKNSHQIDIDEKIRIFGGLNWRSGLSMLDSIT